MLRWFKYPSVPALPTLFLFNVSQDIYKSYSVCHKAAALYHHKSQSIVTMRILVSAARMQLLRQAAGKRPVAIPKQSSCQSSTQLPACFSTHGARRAAQKPSLDDKKDASRNSEPEMPAFSLSGLGLSKNMRIGLLVIISIFGTIETWFYCQAIWRWWKGKQAAKEIEAE